MQIRAINYTEYVYGICIHNMAPTETGELTITKELVDVYLNLYTDCMKYKNLEKRDSIDCSNYYNLFETNSGKHMQIKEEQDNRHK